jgi:hypothetical protein
MIDFNHFKGEGRKLSNSDISSAASLLSIEPAALAAVISVETGGSGFDKLGRPRILFEPHIFYRQLAKDPYLQHVASDLELAYPKWGTLPYPKTSDANYERLEHAMELNPEAALRSCSWGLGQIMGFNFSLCGAPTIESFVLDAMDSEHEQLIQMCHFIMASRLDDELQRQDWAGFARGYNGPAFATNRYDTKLSEAYTANKQRFA